jgi:general stress protein 26
MKVETQRTEDLKHLGELVDKIGVGMLTTLDKTGSMRCRPLATLRMDAEPALWFLTSIASPKIAEIDQSGTVGLSYSDGDANFVSITGTTQISRDRDVIASLWTPLAKLWFPDGVDDRNIAALKVQIHRAEYWDRGHNKLKQLFDTTRALVTGDEIALGSNEKIDVSANA